MSISTREQWAEVLSYDPDTGLFRWLTRTNRVKAGDIAGSDMRGYIVIRFRGKNYFAHRLAWLFAHGAWPANHIDHANGIPSDNRISNLRECTRAENLQNCKTRRDNRVGLTGVTFHKHAGQYSAEITHKGQRHHLGYHKTPEEAHAAYLAAKASLHTFQPTPRKSPLSSHGESL